MSRHPAGPLKVQPLWARVDANRVKLAAFVVTFVGGSAVLLELAMVVVPGSLISLLATDAAEYFRVFRLVVVASSAGLVALGGLIAAVQLANAEDWVRNRFRGRDLLPDEAPALHAAVADMALAAGLAAAPRLIVIEAAPDSVNALAVGTVRSKALLGFTPGFISGLTPEEQRAASAALIARITAGDIMFGTALAALMGPIKAVRELHASAGAAGKGLAQAGCGDPGCVDVGCVDGCGGCSDMDSDGCGGAVGFIVFAVVVAAITYVAVVSAAWIVTLWGRMLQRTVYEKADAEGMLLVKDPASMLSALSKTSRASNLVAEGDSSYDGIFYAATSGTPRVERVERRRHERLREVLATEGVAAGPLEG